MVVVALLSAVARVVAPLAPTAEAFTVSESARKVPKCVASNVECAAAQRVVGGTVLRLMPAAETMTLVCVLSSARPWPPGQTPGRRHRHRLAVVVTSPAAATSRSPRRLAWV